MTDRLARVLGLLGSAHDGEVLAAARKAEEIRLQMGKSWAELIESSETDLLREGIAVLLEENRNLKDELDQARSTARIALDKAFGADVDSGDPGARCSWLLQNADLPEGIEGFVESLADQWRRRRWLSAKQRAALENIWERNCRG